jgi:hypothetical protein
MHINAYVAMGNAPRLWGQDKMIFILYLGGSTIMWLKVIFIIIYCPSFRKLRTKWTVISRMKRSGTFSTSITTSLHTREAHRNRNAPCDYTYIGSSGKPEVTIEIS